MVGEEAAPAGHPRGAWVPLGRVGGVRLYADPWVLLVVAGLVVGLGAREQWTQRLAWAAIVLGSVLWHELGHAVAARLRGLVVGGVYLHLLPFAYVQRGTPADVWRVALAGPAASLVLFALLHGLGRLTGAFPLGPDEAWWDASLSFAAGVNLLMGLVNLLPILPLDGGRVLRGLVLSRTGDGRLATSVTGALGLGCGLLIALFGAGYARGHTRAWIVAVGLYFCVIAWRERMRPGADRS